MCAMLRHVRDVATVGCSEGFQPRISQDQVSVARTRCDTVVFTDCSHGAMWRPAIDSGWRRETDMCPPARFGFDCRRNALLAYLAA
jgi:hypothetical protein